MKRNQFLSSLSFLFLGTIVLFIIHSLVVMNLEDDNYFYYPVWSIYLFHFIVTALVFGLLSWVGRWMPQYVGYTFMGTILLKMIVSIVFLLPLIQLSEFSKIPDFFSFFIPYFIFLLAEIILTMRILQHSGDKY